MARVAQVAQIETDTVALDLAPLVAPHRKQGRLSLRIERMPQGTRLTRGTRNNDNTWSLASDELEDLSIQVPANAQKEFKIGVRVISLINGSTLVAVDVPVKSGETTAGPAVGKAVHTGISPADAAELSVLRQELAAAKEALAARDGELAERLAAAATNAAAQFQQTLARAETAWTENENARLASVQQQWQEKFAEALAEVDAAQTQTHEAQVRELQEQLETLQATVFERDTALAQAQAAGTAARERDTTATQDALAKLADAQAKLAERDAEVARAHAAADAQKRDAEAALTKAEQTWRDGEAARLAAAEAQWRESSSKALAEAHANADAQRAQGSAGERDLATRVAELQAAISERDAALTRAQTAAEHARIRAAQEAADRFTKAEQGWKAAESARLSAIEATWQAKLETVTAAAQAAPSPALPPANEAEVQELRDKLNALQAKLTLRDAAAGRAAKLADEERRRWQKEAQDVIVKAARERKADENARLAAAQTEWTKQSVRELALVTARAEAAEAALTQLRIRASEEAPLQKEIASLRSALAIREAELEHYRGPLPSEDEALPQPETVAQEPSTKPRSNRMMRDGLIAAAIGVAAVVLWPALSPLVTPPPPPLPAAPVVAAPTQPKVLPLAVLSKDAKLRATPSMYGDIVGKLARDTKVEMIETKGDWTLVRPAEPPTKGAPAEGWAKSSLLDDLPSEPEPPKKQKKKK